MRAILSQKAGGAARNVSLRVGNVEVAEDEMTVRQYEYRMLIDDYMTQLTEQRQQIEKDNLIKVIKTDEDRKL